MPRPLAPLLIALLGMFTAQQLLAPTLGPLSAQFELSPTQLGLVYTVGSVAVVVSSPLWGLAFDRFGLRPVLLAGAGLSLAGLAGFAAASVLVLDETLTPALTFALALLFRSFLLGAGISAVAVAALAVAGRTPEALRTTAVGLVGAAQGLGVVIGPAIGGVLAVGSLLVPLYVAPAPALLFLVWVLVAVKPEAVAHPQPMAPAPPPQDLVRIFGVGLLTYVAFVLVNVSATLLAFDRLDTVSGTATAAAAVAVLGIGVVIAQGVLVPVLRWPADRLMPAGALTAVAGCGLAAVAGSMWLTALAFLVLAVGFGFALTGFFAAATLGVRPRHAGLVAGAAGATSGLAGLVVPMMATVLHSVHPVAPVVAAGVASVLAAGLALVPRPVPQSAG
ncbi:MFS transporter [Lentzea sp. NPDC006480]|uniref:MFS transporter n=1 Tax=Lentzea sp. NPDC006480 TaxID=3157176 RepID=UPI0033BD00A6